DERLAAFVEVDPPLVARALREDLELAPRRMEAPHRGIELDALAGSRAGLPHLRLREDAVAAIEPAVGTPRKGVQELVHVLMAPAVEHDLRRARGLVVALFE